MPSPRRASSGSQRLDSPATDPRRRAVPGDLEAEGLCRPRCTGDAPNDSQMILSTLYQALTVSRTERSASTEKEDGLQERSLPRTIVPADQRQPRRNLKLRVLDAAQTRHGELSESHASSWVLNPTDADRRVVAAPLSTDPRGCDLPGDSSPGGWTPRGANDT